MSATDDSGPTRSSKKRKKSKRRRTGDGDDDGLDLDLDSDAFEDAFGGGDDDDGPWGKHATILKAFGKLGVKKTIAFSHDKDIHCALDYEEDAETLPEGTP